MVTPIITKSDDVFTKDLSEQLQLMWNIQHATDVVLGATLPNLSHYWMNPMEYVELQR